MTQIEWTDQTWNPVTGCTKIGPGCDHCYAERIALRFRNHFTNGFDLTLHPERLAAPALWRKPRRIFVNSMSDLFHKDIPIPYIDGIFKIMEAHPRHQYQILTKRSSLMRDYTRRRYEDKQVPAHIWLGVSVEDAERMSRIDHLRGINAAVRFVSFEPLLGPVSPNLSGIHWAIVGGESGPRARPMEAAWARLIRSACEAYGTAFFFKQWGGRTPKSGGRTLDGREWNDTPPRSVQLTGLHRDDVFD